MKNKYLIAFNLGAILFLATQSGWAQVSCQSDGSGGITCINNCTQPIQSNANVQLTTNGATRDSIQKIIYNFISPDDQGSDGLSTLSDQGDLSFKLSRTFPLNLNPNGCQENPNYNNSLKISNCKILSYSGSPQTVDCNQYLSYQIKMGN